MCAWMGIDRRGWCKTVGKSAHELSLHGHELSHGRHHVDLLFLLGCAGCLGSEGDMGLFVTAVGTAAAAGCSIFVTAAVDTNAAVEWSTFFLT